MKRTRRRDWLHRSPEQCRCRKCGVDLRGEEMKADRKFCTLCISRFPNLARVAAEQSRRSAA